MAKREANGGFQPPAAATMPPPPSPPPPPTAAQQQMMPPLSAPPPPTNGPVPGPMMSQIAGASLPPPIGQSGGGIIGMMRSYNLGAIEDVNIRLLDPKLDYEAVITKAEGARSSTGNDMLQLELKVTFPVEYAGVKLWDQCVFTDTSMWKFKGLARACSLLSPDGSVFIGSSEQDFVDNVVRFQVKNNEYPEGSGTWRNKVSTGYTEGYESPGLQGGVTTVEVASAPQFVQPPVATQPPQPPQPPPTAVAAPSAPPPPQRPVSPDGNYEWHAEINQWVPVQQQAQAWQQPPQPQFPTA